MVAVLIGGEIIDRRSPQKTVLTPFPLTPGMSPRPLKISKETIPALLLEEFARPSIRRHSDGHQNQETEIPGLAETLPWEADRADPGARAGCRAGTLWHRFGRLRETPFEMDAVQLLWQGPCRTNDGGTHQRQFARHDAAGRRALLGRRVDGRHRGRGNDRHLPQAGAASVPQSGFRHTDRSPFCLQPLPPAAASR